MRVYNFSYKNIPLKYVKKKTGNGHNEKWYDSYLQSVALKLNEELKIALEI